MYKNNIADSICCEQNPATDVKEQDFISIVESLENESERFFNLSNELYRKIDGISRFTVNETDSPEQKQAEPNDFVSKVFYEINNIRKQNEKLKYLLSHLNSIL